MVNEGIVLGYKISNATLEVDPAKIDVVSKLPSPSELKPLGIFLGHAGFYRRFIKGFSQIAKPLSTLLCTDQPFNFNENFLPSVPDLKDTLNSAPILLTLNWLQPF